MPPTRTLILEYLEKHRSATAAELSRSFGLTPADVRYHLKALRESGEIEPAVSHTTTNRGRPARSYRLALAKRPNDLSFLCSVLLKRWQTNGDVPADLSAKFLPPPPEDSPVTHRLNRLIRLLNEHHYEARWEAHAAGPRVVFANCPFAPIVAEHPELCQMDRLIIEQWSKMSTEQIARIDPEILAPPACIFQVLSEHARI